MLASYRRRLLCLMSMILFKWIREEEATWVASTTQLPVAVGIPDQLTACTRSVGMGPWVSLILAELRFLCLLHDLLGGVNHPFVGPLINSFCVQNAQQLEALLTLWCEPLTNGGSLQSSGQSTLPSISELLHQRVLSPDRIQLAKAVCALFWRAQVADQSLGICPISCGSGQPNLGMNVLFRSDLSTQSTCLSSSTSKRSATNRLQLQRIEHHLDELVLQLTHLCPSPEEPAQHIHAELLASCALLLRCSDLSSSGPMSHLDRSSKRVDLLDCTLSYITQLSTCVKLSTADEMALRQASALVLQLWDVCSESTLICDRLVQTGVLNNLLNTLEQYSKLREGAALSHDILTLVSRLILPPPTWDPSPAIKRLYPDLKKANLSVDLENTAKTELSMEPEGTELTTATRVSLRLLCLMSMILFKWIREEEATWVASTTQLPVAVGIPDQLTACTRSVGMGPWVSLILAELRFLCLLHDLLGGVNHPFVGPLINSFCVQNAQQLEALLTLWCEPLTNGGSLQSSGQSTLPSISELLHQRVLSPDRIQLAKAVCALFWRAQVADQSLGICPISCGSGQPNLGMNVLFRSDLSTQSTSPFLEVCMAPTRYLPVYGPASNAQFVTSLFQLVERQTHLCAVLLQRPGFRGTVKPTVTTTSVTPIKSVIGCFSSPSIVTRKSSSGSPLLNASDAVNLQSAGLHCLFIVQLPSLGYLSLLSSEELHQLRSPVQLVFNAPYLADSSPELTFGVLLTLSHSLGHLISKVGGHMKSSQLVPEYTHLLERRCKLLSLLVQAHEMTLTILFSQATLMLASARTPLADKQLLVRELAGELVSTLDSVESSILPCIVSLSGPPRLFGFIQSIISDSVISVIV
ncbi:hypothetical protein AHF37_10665 [Paragonimus kellicotti]|nr:hypothetical protein AHF37_10665 [Paragonimus kellicotti]